MVCKGASTVREVGCGLSDKLFPVLFSLVALPLLAHGSLSCGEQLANRWEHMESGYYRSNFFVHFANNGSEESSREAYLFLPGFPAEAPPDPKDRNAYPNIPEKAADIAEKIRIATGRNVYLLHYEGLGKSKGDFSFDHALKEARAFAKYLKKEKHIHTLHLVGNSWGGLVAIDLYRELGDARARLLLISPFTEIPSKEILTPMLDAFVLLYPNRFAAHGIDTQELLSQMEKVRMSSDPQVLIEDPIFRQAAVTIIHGSEDEEIPLASSRRLLARLSDRARLVQVPGDHVFSASRTGMLNAVAEAVQ